MPGLGPFKGPKRPSSFQASAGSAYQFSLTGTCVNGAGTVLPNCIVHLFDSATDTKILATTSDANGRFTFHPATNSGFFYVVAYLPGSPDIAGTSVNTLVAT